MKFPRKDIDQSISKAQIEGLESQILQFDDMLTRWLDMHSTLVSKDNIVATSGVNHQDGCLILYLTHSIGEAHTTVYLFTFSRVHKDVCYKLEASSQCSKPQMQVLKKTFTKLPVSIKIRYKTPP